MTIHRHNNSLTQQFIGMTILRHDHLKILRFIDTKIHSNDNFLDTIIIGHNNFDMTIRIDDNF